VVVHIGFEADPSTSVSGSREGEPLTKEQANECAASFVDKVLGKSKYKMRIKGFINRLLGKYKTIAIPQEQKQVSS